MVYNATMEMIQVSGGKEGVQSHERKNEYRQHEDQMEAQVDGNKKQENNTSLNEEGLTRWDGGKSGKNKKILF